MTPYTLMIKTNHYLIQGGTFTEPQKQNIVRQLLSAVTTKEQANRFYKSVRFPNNTDDDGRRMYPLFFIPPYNDGKKYKTIFNQIPKTHILSANMYELEILRLLWMFASADNTVKDMIDQTLVRLKTTCYGGGTCGVGECFDTSLVVLRFLAAVAPQETEWIKSRIENFYNHVNGKYRHGLCTWYFWLCLSEMPFPIAEPEILRSKEKILNQLNRSSIMNNENNMVINPVLICAIRNTITRLPDYAYLKDRMPYISEKDQRLHFDMEK